MKTGEARGRPSWESLFLGDPGANFFCRKRENGPNQEETGQEKRSDPSGRHVLAQIRSVVNHGGTYAE